MTEVEPLADIVLRAFMLATAGGVLVSNNWIATRPLYATLFVLVNIDVIEVVSPRTTHVLVTLVLDVYVGFGAGAAAHPVSE
jgi:hypothetical protein